MMIKIDVKVFCSIYLNESVHCTNTDERATKTIFMLHFVHHMFIPFLFACFLLFLLFFCNRQQFLIISKFQQRQQM